MSQSYDNTNRGILFKNDRKEEDSHPDYKGSINVGGREFWLSGWKKDTKKGLALSITIKPKDARPSQAATQSRAASAAAFDDDDTNF